MSLFAELQRITGGKVEADAALAGRTSVRVGGKADLLAAPATEEALAKAIDACVQNAAPYHVLGGGANTIVSDSGVRGVVFKLPAKIVAETSGMDGESGWFRLGAGQPITRLVTLARSKDLVGTEFLVGIPGTIGGAVSMNAGTKSGWIGTLVEEIGIVEPGRVRTLKADEVGFAYRRTGLPEHAVIVWAKFKVKPGDVNQARMAMDEDLAYRRRTQPLSLPNSGSIFRNPPGDFAARLIQGAGLKGKKQGEAQISEQHANFIVNRGAALAKDVVGLMKAAQDAVLEKFQILLIPEVKLVGEFEPGTLPRGIGLRAEPAA